MALTKEEMHSLYLQGQFNSVEYLEELVQRLEERVENWNLKTQKNMEQPKAVTVAYKDATGFMRHFKVSPSNPRDFKTGDKYIIVGQSIKPQVVESDYRANKLNHSIVMGDKIRRCYE